MLRKLTLAGWIVALPVPVFAQQSWAVSFGDLASCGNNLMQVSTDLGTSIIAWPDRSIPPAGEDLTGNFQRPGWIVVGREDGTRIRARVVAAGLSSREVGNWLRRCILDQARRPIHRP